MWLWIQCDAINSFQEHSSLWLFYLFIFFKPLFHLGKILFRALKIDEQLGRVTEISLDEGLELLSLWTYSTAIRRMSSELVVGSNSSVVKPIRNAVQNKLIDNLVAMSKWENYLKKKAIQDQRTPFFFFFGFTLANLKVAFSPAPQGARKRELDCLPQWSGATSLRLSFINDIYRKIIEARHDGRAQAERLPPSTLYFCTLRWPECDWGGEMQTVDR